MSKNIDITAHKRTREDHSTEIMEDYVEAIAEIIQESGVCRVKDLTSRFAVTHVTVIKTIQRLVRADMVHTEPYKPVELTKKGQDLARRCKERHEIVYQFLLAIGVEAEVAAIDAEGIEHHVSPSTLRAFQKIAEGAKG